MLREVSLIFLHDFALTFCISKMFSFLIRVDIIFFVNAAVTVVCIYIRSCLVYIFNVQ